MEEPTIIRTLPAASVVALVSASAAFAQTTLDVVAWKGNEAEPAGLPELIEKFEAENPNIDVELTYVARKDVDKVIPPRFQSGNPPDVTMVDSSLVDLWGGAGFLTDLGTDSAWYGQMQPAVSDVMTTDGKIMVFPLEVIGMGVNFLVRDIDPPQEAAAVIPDRPFAATGALLANTMDEVAGHEGIPFNVLLYLYHV